MTAGIDPAVNGDTLVAAIEEARAGGATMLFTPEMSGLIDSNATRAGANVVAEDADTTLARVCAAARGAGLWVHLGSLALRNTGEDKRWFNRGFVIDATGAVVARYDKMHLFDVDLPTGESWRESSRYRPGECSSVVESPMGRLGLSICYDIRFPALYQALSAAGAQVIAIPAAFTVPTGQAHWHVLMRARAIENAAFVVAAAQVGLHEDGRSTFGHSLVADPWGRVVLDMEDRVGVEFCEVDLAVLDDVRKRIPVIDHRRPVPPVQ
jgi:predicted amidohydrolase